MDTLAIDIETYSDVSLPDCGVHRYAASEQFEILLFAWQNVWSGLREHRETSWTYGQRSESLIWGRGLEDISAATVTDSSFRISGIVRSSFRINRGKGQKKKYMN